MKYKEKYNNNTHLRKQDSERSNECIDFIMMCVFFVSIYSITCRNNASISNFRGGFQCKRLMFKLLQSMSKSPTFVKKYKTMFSLSFPSNSYRENSNLIHTAYDVQQSEIHLTISTKVSSINFNSIDKETTTKKNMIYPYISSKYALSSMLKVVDIQKLSLNYSKIINCINNYHKMTYQLTFCMRFQIIGSEILAPVCTRHSTQTGTFLTRVAHRQTHSLRLPPCCVRPRMQLTHFSGPALSNTNIIGVINNMGCIIISLSNAGIQLKRKKIEIVNDTYSKMSLILWNSHKIDNFEGDKNDIIVSKNIKVITVVYFEWKKKNYTLVREQNTKEYKFTKIHTIFNKVNNTIIDIIAIINDLKEQTEISTSNDINAVIDDVGQINNKYKKIKTKILFCNDRNLKKKIQPHFRIPSLSLNSVLPVTIDLVTRIHRLLNLITDLINLLPVDLRKLYFVIDKKINFMSMKPKFGILTDSVDHRSSIYCSTSENYSQFEWDGQNANSTLQYLNAQNMNDAKHNVVEVTCYAIQSVKNVENIPSRFLSRFYSVYKEPLNFHKKSLINNISVLMKKKKYIYITGMDKLLSKVDTYVMTATFNTKARNSRRINYKVQELEKVHISTFLWAQSEYSEAYIGYSRIFIIEHKMLFLTFNFKIFVQRKNIKPNNITVSFRLP
ncbi:hypothetical protein AGLY_009542 [Aphis glycines]|uniref:Replication protein A OB domain-containing protein n=1 Tax=Aphis glycines TaxID=307491 RepID=A0A6G0TJX6_APHGL|nr:hypothetical protein AGLY_009542 [Aphis glycines]